jgi:hypothetical protein
VVIASGRYDTLVWRRPTAARPAVISGGRDSNLSRTPAAIGAQFVTRTQPAPVLGNAHPETRYFHYFVLFLVAANISDVLSMSNISEYILEVTFILI